VEGESQAAYQGIPLVRHRDDVGVEHVEPLRVPHVGRADWSSGDFCARSATARGRSSRTACSTTCGQRLAVHPPLVLRSAKGGENPLVELVASAIRSSKVFSKPSKGSAALAAASRSGSSRCPGRARRARSGPRLLPTRAGFNRSPCPRRCRRERHPSRTAKHWSGPTGRCALLSLSVNSTRDVHRRQPVLAQLRCDA